MHFDVVMVDDDEMCLFLHRLIVVDAGFHTSPQTYNSAKGALECFSTERSTDRKTILFLDLNMPEMNGWELLDIIHSAKFTREIYVVIVSSSVDERDKERARSFSKVIEFVEKPLSGDIFQKLTLALPWIAGDRNQKLLIEKL